MRITACAVFQIIAVGFHTHEAPLPARRFVVAVVFVVYGPCQSRTNIDAFLWIDGSMDGIDGWNRWMDPFFDLIWQNTIPKSRG